MALKISAHSSMRLSKMVETTTDFVKCNHFMKIKGNDKIQLNKTRILLSVLDHFVWSLFGSVYISISFSFRFVSFGTLFTLDYLVVVALVVFIYYFILWFLFTFYGVSLIVPEQLKYQFASFIN